MFVDWGNRPLLVSITSPFTLQELSAADSGVLQNMFLDFTAITFENILGISRGSHLTFRTFSIDALGFRMPQIFWNEMVLWPIQLSIV